MNQVLTIVAPPPKSAERIISRDEAGSARERYRWQCPRQNRDLPTRRSPITFPWGYYAKEQQETYVGLFFWFKSLHELLTYIAEVEPALYIDDEEAAAVAERLKDVRDRHLSRDEINTKLLGIELELALGEYLAFHWIGRFDDLCAGRGEFAANLIADFFSDDDEYSETHRVPTSKRSAFANFLQRLNKSL